MQARDNFKKLKYFFYHDKKIFLKKIKRGDLGDSKRLKINKGKIKASRRR